MLEKPGIPEDLLLRRTQEIYNLHLLDLEFLPVGADGNTAACRLKAKDGISYFLKLRGGKFDALCAALPQFLHQQGIQVIIAPILTQAGELWGEMEGIPSDPHSYKLILYPYIEGVDEYHRKMTEEQMVLFGDALQKIHAIQLPDTLLKMIRTETYSGKFREQVKQFQQQVESEDFSDPIAQELANFMRLHRRDIDHFVERAGQLAQTRKKQPASLILCHSDLHPGNILLSNSGNFYIVDWDDPVLAPVERDLMYIGFMPNHWDTAREIEAFYQGYGRVQVNSVLLAYYRYERIIQDIAAYCEQLLLSSEGGEDRLQGFVYFTSNFLPGHEIDIALRTDKS